MSDPSKAPRIPDLYERVARIIRTERLRAQQASAMMLAYSPDAPAEDADLETAKLVVTEIVNDCA